MHLRKHVYIYLKSSEQLLKPPSKIRNLLLFLYKPRTFLHLFEVDSPLQKAFRIAFIKIILRNKFLIEFKFIYSQNSQTENTSGTEVRLTYRGFRVREL